MVSEGQTLIFQSNSVLDYRKLRDSRENRTRISGWNSSHLTFLLSWPTELTELGLMLESWGMLLLLSKAIRMVL